MEHHKQSYHTKLVLQGKTPRGALRKMGAGGGRGRKEGAPASGRRISFADADLDHDEVCLHMFEVTCYLEYLIALCPF